MRRSTVALLVGLALPTTAAAAPGAVTEFGSGITANAGLSVLVKGPDGNLWFTEFKANRIGRVTATGAVTELSAGISAGAGPVAIVAGSDGMATLIVVRPAPGSWQIQGTDADPVTQVDQAEYQANVIAHGIVVARGASRTLRIAYTLPAGAKVTLVERGGRVNRVLVAALAGTACPRAKGQPAGVTLLCATYPFVPADGATSTRQIVAVVARGGVPEQSIVVATFKATARAVPATPSALALVRAGSTVKLAWAAATRPRFFTISVTISDGRKLAFNPAGSCRGLLIPRVGAGLKVTVRVAGVRADLVAGRGATLTINGGRRSAGSASRPPASFCR